MHSTRICFSRTENLVYKKLIRDFFIKQRCTFNDNYVDRIINFHCSKILLVACGRVYNVFYRQKTKSSCAQDETDTTAHGTSASSARERHTTHRKWQRTQTCGQNRRTRVVAPLAHDDRRGCQKHEQSKMHKKGALRRRIHEVGKACTMRRAVKRTHVTDLVTWWASASGQRRERAA